jgi:uncharacterized protein (TIGR02099 family)
VGSARGILRRSLALGLRLLALFLIALASLLALLQLAWPWFAADTTRVERALSSLLGTPIRIERSQAEWRGREAVLRLDGLVIGGDRRLAVERAELSLDPLRLIARMHDAAELRLYGLAVAAEWDGNALRFSGLPERTDRSGWPGLMRFTVEGGRLAVRGLPSWPAIELDQVALASHPERDGERWGGRARLPGQGGSLAFVWLREARGQRGYLRIEAADLGRILAGLDGAGIGIRGGRGSIELWLELRPDGGGSLATEFSLSRVGLFGRGMVPLAGTAVEPRRSIALLSGWLRAERIGGRWRSWLGDLSVDGFRGAQALLETGEEDGYRLYVRGFPLGPLAAGLALADGLPSSLRAWLFASAPEGVLESLELEFDRRGLTALRGEARGLRLRPALGLPGLGSLDASFRGDGEGVVAELGAEAAALEWPAVFPEPLSFTAERLALTAARDRIELSGEGIELGGLPADLRLEFDPQSPERGVGAAVVIGEAHIAPLVARLPYGVIPPRTAAWLRRALQSGVLRSGRAVFQGRPERWPFLGGEGGLRVDLELRDSALAFHSRWPVAEIGAARLHFRDRALRFVASAGQVGGLGVPAAEGEIPDLDRAELSLRAAAVGRGEDLVGFLRASPLVHRYGPWLIGQRLEGMLDGEVELLLRVHDPAAPDEVRGRIRLHEMDLADVRWGFELRALTGELRFDQDGLRTDGLSARLGQSPIRLAFASGSACADPGHAFEAELRGRLGLEEVLSLSGMAGRLPVQGSGSAEWLFSLSVARGEAGVMKARLSSSLNGIALAGPAPFVKEAGEDWLLSLDFRRSGEGSGEGSLRIGSLLAAAWRASAGAHAMLLRLGELGTGLAPPAAGLRIEGRVPALDLDPWITGTAAPRGPLELQLELGTEALRLFGMELGAVSLRMSSEGQDLRIVLDGERVAGELRWIGGQAPRLVLDLERLHGALEGDSDPLPSLDPRRLPEITARIASLRLGDADLGEFRLETRADPEGVRLVAVEARTAAFSLHGRGTWLKRGDGPRTRLALELTATELARALGAFGFAPGVADGPILAEAELEWPGSPLDMALERLSGRLRVQSGPGRVLALEPGAGRLLGLISLESLPKRMMLDFRDVLAPGMSFDGFSGSFVFAEGEARTDDFEIQAPGVRIEIRGATDLRTREYDQRVEVRPEVGSALPLIGALAAGAPGVAAGMLARNVLAGPLGAIGRVEYHLSGPWERPVLTRLAVLPRPPSESR